MGGGPEKEHVLIALWGPEPKHTTAELKRRFPYFDIKYFQGSDDISKEIWESTTILITVRTLPASKELVPNLKLIHLFTAGVDGIASHPIVADSTIPITTSSGIHGPPIAEWITLTALAASRYYAKLYEWQKERTWSADTRALTTGTDWVGKTVGVAGYGSIGRQAARIFAALGANIHAYTAGARPTPASRADHGYIVPNTGDPDGSIPRAWYSGTGKESLHTFLASGLDALIIALPLTKATHHLFGKEEFAILGKTTKLDGTPKKSPKGAFLINIARGPLVQSAALVEALNDEVLSGAALDVTEPEPLPSDNPLWDAKNIIITPHVSSLGIEYQERAYDLFLANWARHERGEKMFNLVDRERGY